MGETAEFIWFLVCVRDTLLQEKPAIDKLSDLEYFVGKVWERKKVVWSNELKTGNTQLEVFLRD